jgi:PKD repeat protein
MIKAALMTTPEFSYFMAGSQAHMDVGISPYRWLTGWVAVVAALTSTTLVERAVHADQYQWSLMIAQVAAGTSVTQVDSSPEAIFRMIPEQQPRIGVPFQVDGSDSRDLPDAGPIVNYLWSWDDNTPISNGVLVEHTYTQAGQYTITLTVYDAENNSDTAVKEVTIAASAPPPGSVNHAPTAELTVSPAEGSIDDEFKFDASGSRDADADPLVYRFSFGDGKGTDFTANAVVTHKYNAVGTYVARVTVRDDQNASAEITSSVRVLGPNEGNQSPVALIATGPRTGAAPATLEFDGQLSYDPDGDRLVYLWAFSNDDGLVATQTGAVVNQLFDERNYTYPSK